jgi:hypothetical protein
MRLARLTGQVFHASVRKPPELSDALTDRVDFTKGKM